MNYQQCLNCEATTDGKFCSNCGQKTDTHKITLNHFLQHNLMHGIWHLEKGILFTLKETVTRPGQAALDYIHGKRIRYYNVFYLCLLVIGLNLLLSYFYERILPEENITENDTPQVTAFFKENLKFILLCIVPILGINACLIFKKLKLNLAEHFILSGVSLLGILIISIAFGFMNFINGLGVPNFISVFEVFVFILMLLFPVWSYYNATKKWYTFGQFFWRIMVFYSLVLLELSLILFAIILILTNGKGSVYINV